MNCDISECKTSWYFRRNCHGICLGDWGWPLEHSLCTDCVQVQNLSWEFKDAKKLRSKLCNWAIFFEGS